MSKIWPRLIFATASLSLAACGPSADKSESEPPAAAPQVAEAPAAPAAPAVEPDGKPAAFAVCATCHAVEPDKNLIGPSLFGVIDRPAGTLAGFTYSEAMKNSGITWSKDKLDQFLEAPLTMVPGTRMSFAGMKDAQKRGEVVAYLETLK